jgi:hypothetical protein
VYSNDGSGIDFMAKFLCVSRRLSSWIDSHQRVKRHEYSIVVRRYVSISLHVRKISFATDRVAAGHAHAASFARLSRMPGDERRPREPGQRDQREEYPVEAGEPE